MAKLNNWQRQPEKILGMLANVQFTIFYLTFSYPRK